MWFLFNYLGNFRNFEISVILLYTPPQWSWIINSGVSSYLLLMFYLFTIFIVITCLVGVYIEINPQMGLWSGSVGVSGKIQNGLCFRGFWLDRAKLNQRCFWFPPRNKLTPSYKWYLMRVWPNPGVIYCRVLVKKCPGCLSSTPIKSMLFIPWHPISL